jgi:hypothetical protein
VLLEGFELIVFFVKMVKGISTFVVVCHQIDVVVVFFDIFVIVIVVG